MLLSGPNWPPHRPWFLLFLAGTLGSAAWFFTAALGEPVWPGGSSLSGFTFGIVGGVIILFEFLLWLRKKKRVWRVGRAQTWLRAHIWLGLLTVPVLWFHSGQRLGGWLSMVLMILLWIVVASGLVGLWLQTRLPKRMLDDLPAETIYSQIDRLSAQLEEEAQVLVARVCGLPETAPAEEFSRASEGHLIVGAIRQVGFVQGLAVGTRAGTRQVQGAEPVALFFQKEMIPFLRGRAEHSSPLWQKNRAAMLFQNLKTQVPAEAHEAVGLLENYCERRREWDEQAKLHFWLHSWLLIHFPLSVSLMALMVVHAVVALKYY